MRGNDLWIADMNVVQDDLGISVDADVSSSTFDYAF